MKDCVWNPRRGVIVVPPMTHPNGPYARYMVEGSVLGLVATPFADDATLCVGKSSS